MFNFDRGPRIPDDPLTVTWIRPAAFSILLFSDAAIAAIVARAIHARRNSQNVTLWDVAGAFTMMGCAAAIFSEPDQVVRLFEQLFEHHTPL